MTHIAFAAFSQSVFDMVTVADPVVAGSQPRPKPKFSPTLKTHPQ